MASTIRIKRSQVSGNPSTLAAGELAYSALTDNGSNGGERLYIGMGAETAGNAANHYVIGGTYYTGLIDASGSGGVLNTSAKSIPVLSSTGTIDKWLVGNLQLTSSTLSSTNTNGDINITPNGTGKTVVTNLYIGDSSTSIQEYIEDITGGSITAGNGIDVTYNDGSGTNTVSLNTEYVQDLIGDMVSTNTESGISVTYDDANGKLDFNVNDPILTIAGDADGSATMTNLGNTTINITLDTVNSNVGQFGSSTAIPIVTVNAKGLVTAVSTASISTSLGIAGDTGTDTIALGTDTLTIAGGEGIDVAVTDNTITISGEDASTSNKGVASFDSGDFTVTSGAVSIKTAGVSNSQLENSSVTVGSTTISLGGTSTSLQGLTELAIDNLNINGNEIQSTNANGDIILNPNGTGNIDVSGAKIRNVAEPVLGTDAATKNYVDSAVTGLDWKTAVNLLADSNVALTGSTSTLVIDGHSALDQTDSGLYRILLKGQTVQADNGIYVYTDNGTTYALVRAEDADSYTELINASVWVTEGTTYGQTGWTQTNHYLTDFGSTGNFQSWVQFSGAGAYIAGAGLGQSGTTFFVNVATSGGIEIVSDALQLKSTVAGTGLIYSGGVLDINLDTGSGTPVLEFVSDALTIASTYPGQTSITTLGTVTTGTWSADTIAVNKGGTGLTSYATGDLLYASGSSALSKLNIGTTGKVLQVSAGGLPVWGDVDGGTY